MALPKIKTITDLKNDAAHTIEAVNKGELHIITHKTGDVVLLSRTQYEKMLEEIEILEDFESARLNRENGIEGTHHDEVFKKLAQKHGILNENQVVKKSSRRSR